MSVRQELRWLVDHLPEAEAPVAKRFLEYLTERGSDPVLRALVSAPADDEPVTPEEEKAVRESHEALARGEVLSHEDLCRELGQ